MAGALGVLAGDCRLGLADGTVVGGVGSDCVWVQPANPRTTIAPASIAFITDSLTSRWCVSGYVVRAPSRPRRAGAQKSSSSTAFLSRSVAGRTSKPPMDTVKDPSCPASWATAVRRLFMVAPLDSNSLAQSCCSGVKDRFGLCEGCGTRPPMGPVPTTKALLLRGPWFYPVSGGGRSVVV